MPRYNPKIKEGSSRAFFKHPADEPSLSWKGIEFLLGHRDSLRGLIRRGREVHVSGIAEGAENASLSVIARELRSTLDGCPVCDGSYRNHSFVILVPWPSSHNGKARLHVKQYYDFLDERGWSELLRMRVE